MFKTIKRIKETTDIDEINRLINNGWILIGSYTRYNKKISKFELVVSVGEYGVEDKIN